MDKPKCYGKYKATFPTQGRVCRSCPFAANCKVIEPKKGKPTKQKESEDLKLESN